MSVTSQGTPGPGAALEIRPGEYGERVAAVEPGGVEFIPTAERHGRPRQLLWTWASPNLEFATIFVGVISVEFFGLSFWQALLALFVGTVLGSVTHGVLSARGPGHGVPQMVLGRVAFGHWGNLLPAGLMSLMAGIGWFAVNSVSGAFALAALTHLPDLASLALVVAAQIAVAFFGHNLVHVFERLMFPFLAVVFAVGAVVIFSKSHPGAPGTGGGTGGMLITAAAAFGYAAGWNPYAADYTRYLPADARRRLVGGYAGLGMFLSCFLLEAVGAASVTIGAPEGNPTAAFTGNLPSILAQLTLLAIAVGAVSANVLNIYSGAMAFLTMGLRVSLAFRRALVGLIFGVLGFLVAWSGLSDAGTKYENFLLVVAYWVGPWLGVVFADQWLRRGQRIDGMFFDRAYRNLAGPASMLVGMAISIPLFSNQQLYVGVVARHVPAVGDITFLVGFVLSLLSYLLLTRRVRQPAAQRLEPSPDRTV
ncbi:MAG: cytosine permease [Actinobacteria bacterium]|nr:cytosine permease [Actinomycetota bacterium]